jgi:two-component system, response regulator RegA
VAPLDPVGTILIVDDDTSARDGLARWFESGGWQVFGAGTCSEALGVAAVTAPGYGIVEQRLADGSGLDLLARLRVLSPPISGVVLTRYPSIAAAVHAIRIGFRDYLAKPVDWLRLGALFGIRAPVVATGPANDQQWGAAERPTRPPRRVVFGKAEAHPAGAGVEEESWTLARIEWEHIQSVLFDCRGNVSAAARQLGVHRRSLQRKLRRIAPP